MLVEAYLRNGGHGTYVLTNHFSAVQAVQDLNSRTAQAQGVIVFTSIVAFSRDVELFFMWAPKDYRRSAGYVKAEERAFKACRSNRGVPNIRSISYQKSITRDAAYATWSLAWQHTPRTSQADGRAIAPQTVKITACERLLTHLPIPATHSPPRCVGQSVTHSRQTTQSLTKDSLLHPTIYSHVRNTLLSFSASYRRLQETRAAHNLPNRSTLLQRLNTYADFIPPAEDLGG